MVSKQEFKSIFEQKFLKQKHQFEGMRIFAYVWVFVFSAIVVAGALFYHFYFDVENEPILLCILISIMAFFGLALLPVISFKDRLVKKTKRLKLDEILDIIYGKDIKYSATSVFPQELFDKSNFCNSSYNVYGGEDLFVADIARETPIGTFSTKLVASDVQAKNVVKTENETKTKIVFSGAIAAIKFKQPFGCKLNLNCAKNTGLESLETESSEFNKLFSTRTNNQIQARLILSVTMMQTLIDFQKKAKCKIGLSFSDEFLFVNLNKNIFEFAKKDDKFDFELVEPVYNDLALFDALIEEVSKNRKIFRI